MLLKLFTQCSQVCFKHAFSRVGFCFKSMLKACGIVPKMHNWKHAFQCVWDIHKVCFKSTAEACLKH